MGVAQYIKVDCEEEAYTEILQACPIPTDESVKNSEIQTRIKSKLEELNLKSEGVIEEMAILPGDTINEILSNMEQKLTEIEEQINSKKRSIKKLPEIVKIHSVLLSLYKMTLEIDTLLETENYMAHCDTIVYFEAWVLEKYLLKVEEGIMKITNGICVIEQEKPNPEENVPNAIKHVPLFFEGFESLVFSLGYPRKGEINPTYLMAFTFPFLFGIMFADVGQGAILVIVGILLLIMRKRVDIDKVDEIKRYFLLSAGIITLCGISSMAFGFLFGEFFGPSGVLHPVLLFKIGPFKFGGFDPMHDPLTMIRFAILIGVSFITFALVLRVMNHLKRREIAHVFASLCWIWFLLGGFFMWIYWGGISQIITWFGKGLPMFLVLVITPLIIGFIVMAVAEGFMEGVYFGIEVFIESLGHVLSFCRLAALFLVHTALGIMFLNLAGVENGYFPLATIWLVVVGTILILCIEGLIIMVHCLRLHWIELLPKFYSAKGNLFDPIKIE
jgi:V/A-type H+-transporting ATPase subunit I